MLSTDSHIFPFDLIIQSLNTASKYRTIKAIFLVVTQLYNYKLFLEHINAKNKELERKILIKLSSMLSHKAFKSKEVIKKVSESDNLFFIIMKGKIAELSLKYHKYFLTQEEYIIHLIKLSLLGESEILMQCINLNKDIFPINDNVLKWIYTYNEEKAGEYISKAKRSINEIENMNKGKDMNYYINLTNQFSSKNKINPKTQYHITLPTYCYSSTLKEGNYIGTLSLNKRFKLFSAFVAIEDCSVGVIDKNSSSAYPYLFSLLEMVIKNELGSILNSYFMFNHLSQDYVTNKLSPLFTYRLVKKGEMLFKESHYYEGIYLVKKGEFRVTTNKKYDELNSLIVNLKHSLDGYQNYQTDLKDNLFEDFSNVNIELDPLVCSSELAIRRKIIREIKVANINKRQIIGLSEYYNKYNILHFNVECTSKSAEVFFLPKESFFSIISKDSMVEFNAGRLTEKNAKLFIEEIRTYKKQFKMNIGINARNYKVNRNRSNFTKYHESIHSSSSILIRPTSNIKNKLTSFNSTSNLESKPSILEKRSTSQPELLYSNEKKIKLKHAQKVFSQTLSENLLKSDKKSMPTVFPTLFCQMQNNTIQPYNIFLKKKTN